MESIITSLNTHSAEIRMVTYVSLLIIFFSWETYSPRVAWTLSRLKRDTSNISLTVINTILIRLIFPMTAAGVAIHAENAQFGLLNSFQLPGVAKILLTVVLLDLAIYFQHIAFHLIPLFWRLHRVHHLDKDLDVTSGNRFHPIEMLLSMLIKISIVYLLGLNATGVILFSILLNASSLFNHSNIFISEKFDRVIKFIIVTPDMHRIHHSEIVKETNSNYGFFFSFWDRIFKTYSHKEFNEQKSIKIGLKDYNATESTNLLKILLNPFK